MLVTPQEKESKKAFCKILLYLFHRRRAMRPKQSYLICATPRSGSYLLCEALTNTSLAGRPTEFFDLHQEKKLLDYWQLTVNEYDQYISKVFSLGTTPNGVFGAKIHWFTFDRCMAKFRTLSGYSQMGEAEVL